MARKKVVRTDVLPACNVCRECWFYEPIDVESGTCLGNPPKIFTTGDDDVASADPIVSHDRRWCHLGKPRHNA